MNAHGKQDDECLRNQSDKLNFENQDTIVATINQGEELKATQRNLVEQIEVVRSSTKFSDIYPFAVLDDSFDHHPDDRPVVSSEDCSVVERIDVAEQGCSGAVSDLYCGVLDEWDGGFACVLGSSEDSEYKPKTQMETKFPWRTCNILRGRLRGSNKDESTCDSLEHEVDCTLSTSASTLSLSSLNLDVESDSEDLLEREETATWQAVEVTMDGNETLPMGALSKDQESTERSVVFTTSDFSCDLRNLSSTTWKQNNLLEISLDLGSAETSMLSFPSANQSMSVDLVNLSLDDDASMLNDQAFMRSVGSELTELPFENGFVEKRDEASMTTGLSPSPVKRDAGLVVDHQRDFSAALAEVDAEFADRNTRTVTADGYSDHTIPVQVYAFHNPSVDRKRENCACPISTVTEKQCDGPCGTL